MSTYESYDRVAEQYDLSRVPLGAEVIAGALTRCGKPLAAVELLDAGCGTGNYSLALARQVGRITAIDLSAEMLAMARAKLRRQAESGQIVFHQASITAMPFAEEVFDGVVFNQVLHHLESGEDASYGGHLAALTEAYRVLRPGGVVVVNLCSHRQLQRGFWYYDLIPAAREAVLRRCVSGSVMQGHLTACGFGEVQRLVLLDGLMQGARYFDPLGPLQADWRRGDSIWALADADELAAAEAKIRQLEAAGRLAAYVAERDAARQAVGQFTFFTARKPLDS